MKSPTKLPPAPHTANPATAEKGRARRVSFGVCDLTQKRAAFIQEAKLIGGEAGVVSTEI